MIRRGGSANDSQILFTPPADGEYVARVTDVRGFGGPADFHYTLEIRRPRPSFTVRVGGKNPKRQPRQRPRAVVRGHADARASMGRCGS